MAGFIYPRGFFYALAMLSRYKYQLTGKTYLGLSRLDILFYKRKKKFKFLAGDCLSYMYTYKIYFDVPIQ